MVCQVMAVPLLLVIPPLTQLNTPYPSTAYLTGFLRSRGYEVSQADVGIDMVLALFSRDGLRRAFEQIRSLPGELPGEARQMLALQRHYLDSIDPVVAFLQELRDGWSEAASQLGDETTGSFGEHRAFERRPLSRSPQSVRGLLRLSIHLLRLKRHLLLLPSSESNDIFGLANWRRYG